MDVASERAGTGSEGERALERAISLCLQARGGLAAGGSRSRRPARALDVGGARAVSPRREPWLPEPQSAESYVGLSYRYLEAGRLRECEVALEKGIGLSGDGAGPELHARLGFVKYSLGEYRGAIPHLERAVAAIEYNRDVTAALANSYLHVNEWEKAVSVWRARVESDGSDRVALVMLGVFLKCVGRDDEGARYIKEGAQQRALSEP
ncbi:MAG: hypothetical protein LC800_20675, partial [Acidobacteria bacterium]|nr:hypothetical protein [Acidobacteriota bacterium]